MGINLISLIDSIVEKSAILFVRLFFSCDIAYFRFISVISACINLCTEMINYLSKYLHPGRYLIAHFIHERM